MRLENTHTIHLTFALHNSLKEILHETDYMCVWYTIEKKKIGAFPNANRYVFYHQITGICEMTIEWKYCPCLSLWIQANGIQEIGQGVQERATALVCVAQNLVCCAGITGTPNLPGHIEIAWNCARNAHCATENDDEEYTYFTRNNFFFVNKCFHSNANLIFHNLFTYIIL